MIIPSPSDYERCYFIYPTARGLEGVRLSLKQIPIGVRVTKVTLFKRYCSGIEQERKLSEKYVVDVTQNTLYLESQI
jgi:hypothetical protein